MEPPPGAGQGGAARSSLLNFFFFSAGPSVFLERLSVRLQELISLKNDPNLS